MPLYEMGIIIDPEIGPEEETSTLERLEAIISAAEGEIVDRDEWGRRQLAYPIRKKNHGVYHFWKIDADGTVLDKLNFELRTNDHVMRWLTLNLDRELRRKRKGDLQLQAKAAKKAAKAAAVADDADETQ